MDKRLTGMCVYCGAHPDTRDHVPSKVLLDKPYPAHLPVVGACIKCNSCFSLDEQYLACFIECVTCGTVDPAGLHRHNIKRILNEDSALQKRIENSQRMDKAGNLLWEPETDRIRKVILKLAKGHIAYELYPIFEEPVEVTFAPMQVLSEEERSTFEHLPPGKLVFCPEIGSRAFHRMFGKPPDRFEQPGGWVLVQRGRYRYTVVETGGILVGIVLSEYLCCAVFWK